MTLASLCCVGQTIGIVCLGPYLISTTSIPHTINNYYSFFDKLSILSLKPLFMVGKHKKEKEIGLEGEEALGYL